MSDLTLFVGVAFGLGMVVGVGLLELWINCMEHRAKRRLNQTILRMIQ
jgi:hypothetical protein